MMVSPRIDEDIMVDALKPVPPEQIGENASKLRTGASLLLLDAYDRKVTRDQFIAALGAAFGLLDSVGKYEMMSNVSDFDKANGCVTRADIQVTMSGLTSQVALYTDQCTKMAKLIQQCPLDEDKVH